MYLLIHSLILDNACWQKLIMFILCMRGAVIAVNGHVQQILEFLFSATNLQKVFFKLKSIVRGEW